MKKHSAFHGSLFVLSSLIPGMLTQVFDPYNITAFDFSPDYSKDPFPPYPPLAGPDGRIDIENLRGTRLYGWRGCGVQEVNAITQAWKDFHTIADQLDVYNNIAFDQRPAKEFWGASAGRDMLKPETRKQILQINAQAQQMYTFPWSYHPPWMPIYPRYLWVEVRCSTTSDPGADPSNVCRDRKPDNPNCPGAPPEVPPPGDESDMEAFTDNRDPANGQSYDRVTFCNTFFKLPSLSDTVRQGKALPETGQRNLANYDNRARVWFHEVTHMDYFMNTPGQSPPVTDLIIRLKGEGPKDWEGAYKPFRVKKLRNYRGDGYYPQRNADNYAWFAMALYVQKQLGGIYPNLPNVGTTGPVAPPKNFDGSRPLDILPSSMEGTPSDGDTPTALRLPRCGDRTPAAPRAQFNLDPKCDQNALSGVPYNVFEEVLGQWCSIAQWNKRPLNFAFDSRGNVIRNVANGIVSKHVVKREKSGLNMTGTDSEMTNVLTPPPNPDAYKDFSFELSWAPKEGNCMATCQDAYGALTRSICGHLGGNQDVMAASGNVDVGCGTYGHKITGPRVPKPADPAPPQTPRLSQQFCFKPDEFGKRGDIQEAMVRMLTDEVCMMQMGKKIKKGDPSTNFERTRDVRGLGTGTKYVFKGYWMEGCESTVTEFDAVKPLRDMSATCREFLINDYKMCNNKGVGGSIMAGCIVYEFQGRSL